MVQRFGTPSLLDCRKNHNNIEGLNNPEHDNNNDNHLENAIMQSPLPDSTALEAGILEDERPSRLSRVQDNVRNLLRTSVFGSVKSSPTSPTHPPPPPIAARDYANDARTEVLPSPPSTANSSTPTHYTSSPQDAAAATFAQTTHHQQQTTLIHDHRSAMFNTRAVAALNHPDLSDPSLATFSQQKMQRRQRSVGWTRSPPRGRRGRRAAQRAAGSRGVMCALAAVLLATLVATYISIATTTAGLSTTFHILFVLGICLATIVFAYSVIQLFVATRRTQPLFVAVSRHGNQRRHRHNHSPRSQPRQQRSMPTLTGESDFIPTMPIPVHLSSDDVRSDPIVAQPTAGAEITQDSWDKDAIEIPNPPPAYGRWRSSVRANPDLLHWQPVPSPVDPGTPALPSPTYEETMAAAQNESPPSYMTRDSPARQRDMREARAGIAHSQVVEPEMVEARGAGVGLAV